MIDFQSPSLADKANYDAILMHCGQRGCEYSFNNLYLWGRQKIAFFGEHLLFFSQFNRKSVYLFPVGNGDPKPALDAVIADARERGIPCRITGLLENDLAVLNRLYPEQFRYHFDRNTFDYIYAIEDLAELKGKRFQKKRNHINRFWQTHPDCRPEALSDENLSEVTAFAELWYVLREQEDPHADFHMEKAALFKALRDWKALHMEGRILRDGDRILAMTMGSPLSESTFDVHFEKAFDIADGAYAAVNQCFARYLKEKYPALLWLNREDDLGIEGLRKAKLSYNPDHLIEKSWAHLLEDGYDY